MTHIASNGNEVYYVVMYFSQVSTADVSPPTSDEETVQEKRINILRKARQVKAEIRENSVSSTQ